MIKQIVDNQEIRYETKRVKDKKYYIVATRQVYIIDGLKCPDSGFKYAFFAGKHLIFQSHLTTNYLNFSFDKEVDTMFLRCIDDFKKYHKD